MRNNQLENKITELGAQQLNTLLLSDVEHALIDVREIDPFSQQHLLFATPLPLGRLELLVAALLPCRELPIVVCDDGEGLAEKAAERLVELGYSDVATLTGGIASWSSAGYETYSGVNVPSKAFGEFIEHEEQTPSLSADEVKIMLDDNEDMIILDSRPFEEFNWASIPSGLCCSGAELVYRVFSAVPSPNTKVVVNCAGRTRSIIGAQSLINAGLPNKIYALRNGIMGWRLAGHQPATGEKNWAPKPTHEGLLLSESAAQRVASRFSVQQITTAELNQWRTQRAQQSLYMLDVRTLEEFSARHIRDAQHAPGGQIIQATDQYIGARNSRIVLIDNDGIRATMTASWLKQMGQKNVRTMRLDSPGENLVAGVVTAKVLGLEQLSVVSLSVADAAAKQSNGATVIDLSLSPAYRTGHIPGAWFALRSQLNESLKQLPKSSGFILTSENGSLAKLSYNEVCALTEQPVYCLEGGNAAWQNAGLDWIKGDNRFCVEPIDVWRIPFVANEAKGETVDDAMRAYLDWEVDLMTQLGRDSSIKFQRFADNPEA